MKTTLDLPEPLVRELERRAQQAGQDLTQTAAELLWKALLASPPATQSPQRATIKTNAVSGLPYVECSQTAPPAEEMTPDRVAEVLLDQVTTWHHEAGR
jgi:hypothetical protein